MTNLVALKREIASLRQLLAQKEAHLIELQKKETQGEGVDCEAAVPPASTLVSPAACDGDSLPRWAIERYSRQILLSNIGVRGQERLCASRVLVVGAGGLGCPALAYLAGAGIGTLGIVDYDTVDVTNLHRQILHSEAEQGISKVESAARAVKRLNSHVKLELHNVQLSSSNALQLVSTYHAVLDCTDNVATRYLLNDACVLAKVPLISGSALKMEGQLTVYGYRPERPDDKTGAGPCYRCVFPTPPPAETVGSCSAQGVLGAVAGAVGALQALAAVELVAGARAPLAGRLLIFDGEDCSFRNVKLRGRNPACAVCSDTPTVTALIDYEQFCQSRATEKDLELKILPPENRISPQDLSRKLALFNLKCELTDGVENQQNGAGDNTQNGFQNIPQNEFFGEHLLVDVRSEQEFRMCRIRGSVNAPIDSLSKGESFEDLLRRVRNCKEVTFVCRRGNDSQLAAKRVLESVPPEAPVVNDVAGGLHAWARHVDPEFPIY